MAVSRTQVGSLAVGNGAGSRTSSFTSNPNAGDKVIVAIWNFTTTAPTSVTDNAGNTYVSDGVGSGNTGDASLVVRIYRADTIALPGTGTLAVTAALANDGAAVAIAYSGAAAGAPLTNSKLGNTTAAAGDTNSAGRAATGLQVGVLTLDISSASSGIATTAPAGQEAAEQDGSSFLAGAVSDLLNSGASTNIAWTWSGGTSFYTAMIAAYDSAGSAAPPSPAVRYQPPGIGVPGARPQPWDGTGFDVGSMTLTDPLADATRSGGLVDTLASGLVLVSSPAGCMAAGSADTLAIGVVVADPSVGSSRAGSVFGEVAVNSLVLSDPSVEATRSGGSTDTLATGAVLTDGSAGVIRSAGRAETVATGIVLLDVISAARAVSTLDTLAIGVALADPSVGAMRFGNTAGTIAAGLTLGDTAGVIRLGGKTDTLSYALVFADRPGFIRLVGTVDSFNFGSSTGFICQDFSGTVNVESYGGTAAAVAYAGGVTIDAYSGGVSVDSYGGAATNCGR